MSTPFPIPPISSLGGHAKEVPGGSVTGRIFRTRVPDNCAASILVHVVGQDTVNQNTLACLRFVTFKRGTGASTSVGNTTIAAHVDAGAAGWAVTVTATDSGSDHFLEVNATGDAANPTRWTCTGTLVFASGDMEATAKWSEAAA